MIQAKEVLKKYWGFETFRPLQEDIIQAVVDGKDTLALLPTGGGKSMCFQIPGLMKEGVCIVISPLIALMKDQVENLVKKGINAKMINSSMKYQEIDITLDNCVYGDVKFLYVSPERLSSEIFLERVKKMTVSFIVVDEAHCISQWGYDFRPAYLKISEIRLLLPQLSIIALTATATETVVHDIQDKLLFKNGEVFRKSFFRKKLAYMAFREDDKYGKMLKIFSKTKGTAIVYLRSRKNTVLVANFLMANKITAAAYHAGMHAQDRSKVQQSWIDNKIRVIVATNAFGMGIDKPDVRIVIHLDLPESPEAYFQEAGRAGRDEKKAFAVLLFNQRDESELEIRTIKSFPPLSEIRTVYQALANYYQLALGSGKDVTLEFEIDDFISKYKLDKMLIYNCLKVLEDNSLLLLSDGVFQPSKLIFSMKNEALYQFQIKNNAYEALIKLILRAYGGVFDNVTAIDENFMCKKLKIDYNVVVKQLNALHQLKVIYYFAKTSKPTIAFLTERKESSTLQIDQVKYSLKKKNALAKTNAMIGFINSKIICRSRYLLNYFDETEESDCSICDICLEKKKTEESAKDFKIMADKINEAIKNKPMLLGELLKLMNESEKKILPCLRLMLDNHMILCNSKHEYVIK